MPSLLVLYNFYRGNLQLLESIRSTINNLTNVLGFPSDNKHSSSTKIYHKRLILPNRYIELPNLQNQTVYMN